MKITRIDTVRLREHPNLCWVEVRTDAGLTGLGETFFGAGAVEAHIHETVVPLLAGRDPLAIEAISRDLAGYVGFAVTYAGFAVAMDSPVALALLAPCLIVVDRFVIAREEAYLSARFGAEYLAYKGKVRRWL